MIKFEKWALPYLDIYIESFRDSRKVDAEGRYSLSGAAIDEPEEIAFAAIKKAANLNFRALRIAVRKSLFSKNLKKDFKKEDWIHEIQYQYELEVRNNNKQKYVLFTGFFYLHLYNFNAIKFSDCEIRFYQDSQPKNLAGFIKVQKSLLEQHHQISKVEYFQHGYVPIKVFVDAANPYEAADVAQMRLDEIRGLMNFVQNRIKISETEYGTLVKSPINNILPFRYSTIHNSSGCKATDTFWYIAEWHQPRNIADFSKKNGLFAEWFKRGVHQLRSEGPLTCMARVALRMYVSALDTSNFRDAFLRLWAVLEYLALAEQEQRHDIIVKRVSAIWFDRSDSILFLEHLRAARNEMVHKGSDYHEDYSKNLVLRLNRFVCEMIRIYLFNPLNFRNVEEIRHFLDAPTDGEHLERRIATLQKVKQFRRL